jgi:hypothetical protein
MHVRYSVDKNCSSFQFFTKIPQKIIIQIYVELQIRTIRKRLYELCSKLPVIEIRGGAVGWGIALQARKSRVRFPMWSMNFFYWLNPSGRTMALAQLCIIHTYIAAFLASTFTSSPVRRTSGRCLATFSSRGTSHYLPPPPTAPRNSSPDFTLSYIAGLNCGLRFSREWIWRPPYSGMCLHSVTSQVASVSDQSTTSFPNVQMSVPFDALAALNWKQNKSAELSTWKHTGGRAISDQLTDERRQRPPYTGSTWSRPHPVGCCAACIIGTVSPTHNTPTQAR